MLILSEARAPFPFAASGIQAIVSILHTRQLLAIPHRFFRFLPEAGLMIPLFVRGACGIATRPMLVLQEAMTVGILAGFGLHAIHAILRNREDVAIPHVLVLLGPSAIFPLQVVSARLVATCPMLILLEAVTIASDALL